MNGGRGLLEYTMAKVANEDTDYRADLEAMTQTNRDSGMSRSIQAVLVIMF